MNKDNLVSKALVYLIEDGLLEVRGKPRKVVVSDKGWKYLHQLRYEKSELWMLMYMDIREYFDYEARSAAA